MTVCNLFAPVSLAMFDELLSAQGMSATVTNNSGSVLEMTEIPNNIGDRVS